MPEQLSQDLKEFMERNWGEKLVSVRFKREIGGEKFVSREIGVQRNWCQFDLAEHNRCQDDLIGA